MFGILDVEHLRGGVFVVAEERGHLEIVGRDDLPHEGAMPWLIGDNVCAGQKRGALVHEALALDVDQQIGERAPCGGLPGSPSADLFHLGARPAEHPVAEAVVHGFGDARAAHVGGVFIVLERPVREVGRVETFHHALVGAEGAGAHDDTLARVVVDAFAIGIGSDDTGHGAGFVLDELFAANFVVLLDATVYKELMDVRGEVGQDVCFLGKGDARGDVGRDFLRRIGEDAFEAYGHVVLAVGFQKVFDQVVKQLAGTIDPKGVQAHVGAVLRQVEHIVRNLYFVVHRQTGVLLGLGVEKRDGHASDVRGFIAFYDGDLCAVPHGAVGGHRAGKRGADDEHFGFDGLRTVVNGGLGRLSQPFGALYRRSAHGCIGAGGFSRGLFIGVRSASGKSCDAESGSGGKTALQEIAAG